MADQGTVYYKIHKSGPKGQEQSSGFAVGTGLLLGMRLSGFAGSPRPLQMKKGRVEGTPPFQI